mgnify:FL=1|jgi:hypothetical protein
MPVIYTGHVRISSAPRAYLSTPEYFPICSPSTSKVNSVPSGGESILGVWGLVKVHAEPMRYPQRSTRVLVPGDNE